MLYVTSRIGSRNAQTYFYFDATRTEVICGCWSGDLPAFEERANTVYGGTDNKYGNQYREAIKTVKLLMEGANK
jgi:hypothetical protein